jgi:histone H3/H4
VYKRQTKDAANSKRPIGTCVRKHFPDGVQVRRVKYPPSTFDGFVHSYDRNGGYWIKYSNGHFEQMKEEELEQFIVKDDQQSKGGDNEPCSRKNDKKDNDDDDQDDDNNAVSPGNDTSHKSQRNKNNSDDSYHTSDSSNDDDMDLDAEEYEPDDSDLEDCDGDGEHGDGEQKKSYWHKIILNDDYWIDDLPESKEEKQVKDFMNGIPAIEEMFAYTMQAGRPLTQEEMDDYDNGEDAFLEALKKTLANKLKQQERKAIEPAQEVKEEPTMDVGECINIIVQFPNPLPNSPRSVAITVPLDRVESGCFNIACLHLQLCLALGLPIDYGMKFNLQQRSVTQDVSKSLLELGMTDTQKPYYFIFSVAGVQGGARVKQSPVQRFDKWANEMKALQETESYLILKTPMDRLIKEILGEVNRDHFERQVQIGAAKGLTRAQVEATWKPFKYAKHANRALHTALEEWTTSWFADATIITVIAGRSTCQLVDLQGALIIKDDRAFVGSPYFQNLKQSFQMFLSLKQAKKVYQAEQKWLANNSEENSDENSEENNDDDDEESNNNNADEDYLEENNGNDEESNYSEADDE